MCGVIGRNTYYNYRVKSVNAKLRKEHANTELRRKIAKGLRTV